MPTILNLQAVWEFEGKRHRQGRFPQAFEFSGDYSPAFRVIAEDVLAPFVERQFESQGAEGGTRWADLAPSTRKHRSGAPLLSRSGHLLRSFIGPGGDHVEEVLPRKLLWGSRLPYARYHQTGTGKGYQQASPVPTGKGAGRGMPMRSILVLTSAMRRQMTDVMMSRMAEIARLAGYRLTSTRDTAGPTPLATRQLGLEEIGKH